MRALIAGAALGVVACDPCAGYVSGACAPAITLTVSGSDGVAPGATISGAAFSCGSARATTECTASGSLTPGHYTLTISAPGYTSRTLEIDVPASAPGGCFNCGYTPVSDSVTLTRE